MTRLRSTRLHPGVAGSIVLLLAGLAATGCAPAPMDWGVSEAFFDHRYGTAREIARADVALAVDENIVLDHLRLGIAAMADGDHDEAEQALLHAYELLISGGVNEQDRVDAATFIHEGVRIWKGEPYEQAMSFYMIATLYMLRGDWENGRAAATNALFTLRDFEDGDDGQPRSMREIVTDAARSEQDGDSDYLEDAARPVESEFALGYLTAATCNVLLGRDDAAAPLFDQVRQLNPELDPLVSSLESADYDTLLFIDVGRGPEKQSYGPNGALIRYEPDGRDIPRPVVSVWVDDDQFIPPVSEPVVDLWTLSQYPRWWSLQSMREAKSAVGDILVYGGMIASIIGGFADESDMQWAGVGATLAGLLVAASAEADTRHLALLPRSVFIVPLRLGDGRHDVGLHFENDAGSDATWHGLVAGTDGDPRVYWLRMHNGGGAGMPVWSDQLLFSNDHTERLPGQLPYLLGGRDLGTPDESRLDTYQADGLLTDMTLTELIELHRAEGIVFTPGPQGRTDESAPRDDLYRHVVNGGRVLWSPPPGTHGFEQATRVEHPPYMPQSQALESARQRHQSTPLPSGVVRRGRGR